MKSILIVDDEAELRENLAELLQNEGFSTDTAPSGVEALKKAANNRYDVVVLDLIMPGMDGITTMTEMKKLGGRTKYVVVTAFATLDTAVDAIKKGASDYLSKPFRSDELVTLIRRTLEEAKFEDQVMVHDLDQTLNSLANPIRRKIVEMLGSSPPMRMTEITQKLVIEDRTKTMFHLRTLKEAGIIQQTTEKLYTLTQSGRELLGFLNQLRRTTA
ncbi:MAG: response regulator [Magnetococcales bacterium]|nr:response regulator [Magnetococcales bacterium]NGZ26203.1 response regulator [Magnetococcales bacterium]